MYDVSVRPEPSSGEGVLYLASERKIKGYQKKQKELINSNIEVMLVCVLYSL